MSTSFDEELRCSLDRVAYARRAGFDPYQSQARLLNDTSKAILICCHRQWGKSTMTAIMASHCLLYDQYRPLVLIGGPSERQSVEVLRKARDVIAALPWAPKLVADNKTEMEWASGARVIALPANPDRIVGFSSLHFPPNAR